MAQNKIEIFDDSVLKLTVNQGIEEERVEKTLGDFNMGELAFVRDTGRLFVGDCSDDDTVPTTLPTGELNYTKGGVLSGNRYLGMIDSKPLVDFVKGSNELPPLNYENNTNFQGDKTYTEKPMLGNAESESKFKRKNIVDGGKEVFRWCKKAQYNEKYDAYDGDIAYDVYENAIILFDKKINSYNDNILEKNEEKYTHPHTAGSGTDKVQIFKENGVDITNIDDKLNVKYRTPTINLEAQGTEAANGDGESSTHDVYGQGYVVFRNVEPDNVTIEFIPKEFEKNGSPTEQNIAGYSHNVLRIKSVPHDVILKSINFDEKQFITDESGDKPKVSIVNNLSWVTSVGGSNGLNIPSKIKTNVDEETAIALKFVKPGSLSNKEKIIAVKETSTEGVYETSIEDPFNYKIELGDGLTSNMGKVATLGVNETPVIMIEQNQSEYTTGYKDPYHVYDNEVTTTDHNSVSYAGELSISSGLIKNVRKYEDSYKADAENWISKYRSDENTAVNMLKKPLALMWTGTNGSNCNVRANFYNGSLLFANKYDKKTGVSLFSSENKSKVIDLSKAVSSGTKNVLKFNSAVIVDKEYSESEETLPTKINYSKLRPVFEWNKIEETKEDGTILTYYVVSSAYTSDGDQVEVSSIKINDKEIMTSPSLIPDLVVIGEPIIEDNTKYTSYTIYADCKPLLKDYYSFIQFVTKSEGKTETVDLVKNGICKFVTQTMMNIDTTNKTIGANGDYKIVKSFTVNSDLSLTPVASMEPWNNVLSKANGILYIATDPNISEDEDVEEYYYFYYAPAVCGSLSSEYDEPTDLDSYAVRIPEHAKSVLLEVNVYNTSEEEIAVFTSNLYDNLKNCTGTLTKDKPYTYTSGDKQPTFNVSENSVLNIGENETKLLSIKSANYTGVIEVPVYHDETTGRLQFCFRAGNIKPSTSGTFLINLIGYKL